MNFISGFVHPGYNFDWELKSEESGTTDLPASTVTSEEDTIDASVDVSEESEEAAPSEKSAESAPSSLRKSSESKQSSASSDSSE